MKKIIAISFLALSTFQATHASWGQRFSQKFAQSTKFLGYKVAAAYSMLGVGSLTLATLANTVAKTYLEKREKASPEAEGYLRDYLISHNMLPKKRNLKVVIDEDPFAAASMIVAGDTAYFHINHRLENQFKESHRDPKKDVNAAYDCHAVRHEMGHEALDHARKIKNFYNQQACADIALGVSLAALSRKYPQKRSIGLIGLVTLPIYYFLAKCANCAFMKNIEREADNYSLIKATDKEILGFLEDLRPWSTQDPQNDFELFGKFIKREISYSTLKNTVEHHCERAYYHMVLAEAQKRGLA